MCMTVGASVTGSGAFVACDTRSASSGDGLRYDTGGRIVFTGSGWGAGGGAHHALGIALAALRAGAPAVPGVGDYLRAAGYRPGVDVSVRNASSVCVISVDNNDSNRVTVTNGKLWMASGDDLFYSAPGESDAEEDIARLRQMWADVRAAGVQLAGQIRAVATHFAEVSTLFESVSPVIEVGYILPSSDHPRFGFLRGRAAAIANAGRDEILDRFQADCSNLILDEAFEAARAIGQVGQSHGLAASSMDDGQYGLRATESDGSTRVSGALKGQGSMTPVTMVGNVFSYSAGGPASSAMWVAFSWSAFTLRQPDGSTVSVPASSSLATPPSPSLSQLAGGSLGARTRFARIGYMKNGMIVRVGAEASFAISAFNLLTIASPSSVAGYDGWISLVGSSSNTEFVQSLTIPFGTGWTEPTTGFDTTTTPYNNTSWPNAVIATELLANTQYFFYPWYDIAGGTILFPDPGQTARSDTSAAAQYADGRIPLSNASALDITTPTAGNTGAGAKGGARYL